MTGRTKDGTAFPITVKFTSISEGISSVEDLYSPTAADVSPMHVPEVQSPVHIPVVDMVHTEDGEFLQASSNPFLPLGGQPVSGGPVLVEDEGRKFASSGRQQKPAASVVGVSRTPFDDLEPMDERFVGGEKSLVGIEGNSPTNPFVGGGGEGKVPADEHWHYCIQAKARKTSVLIMIYIHVAQPRLLLIAALRGQMSAEATMHEYLAYLSGGYMHTHRECGSAYVLFCFPSSMAMKL